MRGLQLCWQRQDCETLDKPVHDSVMSCMNLSSANCRNGKHGKLSKISWLGKIKQFKGSAVLDHVGTLMFSWCCLSLGTAWQHAPCPHQHHHEVLLHIWKSPHSPWRLLASWRLRIFLPFLQTPFMSTACHNHGASCLLDISLGSVL